MANYSPGMVNVQTTVVNSATVPVSLIPPGFMSASWVIRNRAGSAVAALVFPYTGALPGVAPANAFELSQGATLSDFLASAFSGADSGIGVGWAAVLETGATAITVDAIWR